MSAQSLTCIGGLDLSDVLFRHGLGSMAWEFIHSGSQPVNDKDTRGQRVLR